MQTWLIGIAGIVIYGFVLSSQAAQSGDIDEVSDLIEGRWFETEIIIFERLPILDTNNPEQLVKQSRRSFPTAMIAINDSARIATATDDLAIDQQLEEDVPAPLSREDISNLLQHSLFATEPHCYGFLTNQSDTDEGTRDIALATDPTPNSALLQGVAETSGQLQPSLTLPPVRDIVHPALQAVFYPQQIVPLPPPRQLQIVPLPPAASDMTDTTAVDSSEQTGPAFEVTPLMQLLADVAAFEEELNRTSMTWLPVESLTMVNALKAINRQSDLRPIFHGRWRQDVPTRQKPTQVHFASVVDEQSPATHLGLAKLEGTLSLSIARYLHFEPRLWYHADTIGLDPIALPGTDTDEPMIPSGFMELHESRRMRSGELHYLDHPKLGVIVRIDPVQIPDQLTQRWEDLVAETSDDAAQGPADLEIDENSQ